MTVLERIAAKCKEASEKLDQQYELAKKFENDNKKRRAEHTKEDYMPTYSMILPS